ncbi:hypothetical protein IRJ41_022633, partial [Triplophysa rosa]
DWQTEPDKNKAASLYTKEIICQHEMRKPLFITMDLRMDKEDQDRELVAFYKQNSIEWASPVKCRLQGDAAIGEGVTRHFLSTVIQRLQHGFNFNMASSSDLKDLVKFWLGWEVPDGKMVVEVVTADMPKSSTCFNMLRLPSHYMDFSQFKDELLKCTGTSEFGFGLV